jgi:DNA helicase-2/ATP-dependent DNA helicase PcrA
MNSYAIQSYEEPDAQNLKGVDAVHITTVHQAKGLEWPVVFLTSMNKGRFPSRMVGRKQKWCGVPREMFDAERYEGTEKDERRLCYVAITRAKDVLVITHFNRINNAVSRSDYVEDMNLKFLALFQRGDTLSRLNLKSTSGKEEIQSFAASDLLVYERCPYLYLLGTVWGFQPGLNPRIGFGKSLHHCLRCASELVKSGGLTPERAVARAVDHEFHMPFMAGDVLQEFKENARRRLLDFARERSEDFGKIEEMEYRLEFPLQNATISGRVDVILRDHDTLEVRDYKTSEEAKTYDESATQVRLYALGLRGLGRYVTAGSIAYLEGPDVRPVEVTDESLSQTTAQAEDTIASILSRRFEPRSGGHCGSCDQGPLCRWCSQESAPDVGSPAKSR